VACLIGSGCEARSVCAHLAEIGLGIGKLERVADQPALHIPLRQLHMELQREHFGAVGEGLVRRDLGRGEPSRAKREVERVAMPVQHSDALDDAERRRLALLG
jgi:hypothetical protein